MNVDPELKLEFYRTHSTACQYSDIVAYACVIVESHCQYMYTP